MVLHVFDTLIDAIYRYRGQGAEGYGSYTWTAMSFKRKEWQNRCLFIKIIFTSNIFTEDYSEPCQSSKMEYASRSEHVRVLKMPLVLNMPGFWIYQGSEYARVLNNPGFRICIGLWICQGLNVRTTQGSEYAWIISEYI